MDKLLSYPASLLFLFAAIIVYGLFGSPTPDDPGAVEIAVGGLLVLSIGAAGIHKSFDISLQRSFFLKTLQVMFLCGLILPTLSGVYHGNDRILILRDVLAFAFLGLPLFLAERFHHQDDAARILSWLLVACGVAFALRTLMPVFNLWIPQGELLYLSNSPLALFAGVFLAGSLWRCAMNPSRATAVSAVFYAAALALIIAAMLLDVQRATVGAVFLTLVLLAVYSLVETPRRAVIPVLVLILAGFILYPLMEGAVQAMALKTSQVGLNSRLSEARAVFEVMLLDPLSFFTGKGWGSVFASPAVAGIEVNYTHSLLTTMLLKGGVILLLLTLFVVGAALYQIILIFQGDRVRGLSLFWPLVIPVLLYASHKSLDFGLVLLMIGVWSVGLQTLPTAHSSDKKKEYRPDQS